MRKIARQTVFLVVVLALGAYAIFSSTGGRLPSLSRASVAGAASQVAAALPTIAATNSSTAAAIQTVIQKANQEQATALAKNDPTVMQDTATSGYYDQLVQINQDMANGGVTGIKLVGLRWGPIAQQNNTTAQATTYETWQTTYVDGSSDQSTDRNVYTLVLQQGAWKIQSDDHPDSSASAPPGVGVPNPASPIEPTLPQLPNARSVSQNWSGYAATGGTFTGVTGTWTVPTSTGGSRGVSSGATWVGVGGVQSNDLIQAGTEETTYGSQGVQYDAWIELLPRASRPISLAVNPGDSVTVSINETGANQWRIAFKNNTTGETYQTTVTYSSSLSSAEWVVEAPSAGRGIVPLDNFGTISFSGATAVENGKTVTLSQAGAQPITMIDAYGDVLATPSSVASNGQGFSVSRSTSSSAFPSLPGRPGFGVIPGLYGN